MSLTVDGTSEVVIPVATATSLGVVSVGANLSVDANGVLSALAPTPAYTLPPATETTLGGVIVPAGSGLEVDASGNLSITPVVPVDVQMMYYYTPATPTRNGQALSLTLASSTGCHVLLPLVPWSGGQPTGITLTISVPAGSEEGQAFELLSSMSRQTLTDFPVLPAVTLTFAGNAADYPVEGNDFNGLKFRWSTAQNTWYVVSAF